MYVAPAMIDGKVCLRPCIVNFRTTDDDVRALVELAREVGRRLVEHPGAFEPLSVTTPESPLPVVPSLPESEPLPG